MKKTVVILLAVSFSLLFYAFTEFESETGEALQKWGIPEEIAKDCIWSSFSGGYLSTPNLTTLKKLAAGGRAAAVHEIATFAKTYSRSEDFKKKYLEYREGRKPTPPEKPKSMAEQRKEQKENMQKAIKETEEAMKSMSGDQKEMMKNMITMYKEQLKQIDDPSNPMFSADMERMTKQGYEMQLAQHKEQLTKWEKDYPTSPNWLVKKWLTDFLETSKDVDFNAQLIDGDYGRKLFAKTAYERKDGNWKMCFRAGKQTVEAGRASAKQWLDELNKAK